MLAALDLETRCNVPSCKHYQRSKCEEKHSLQPWKDEITVIGVYSEDGTGMVFRGKKAAADAWRYVVDNRYQLVGHNFKFDLAHLVVHAHPSKEAYEHLLGQWVGDTNLLAATSTTKIPDSWLEEYNANRRKQDRKAGKHSLKTLAPYHLGVEPYWEAEDHDDDEYVLKDCEYTLRLYQKLMDDGGPHIEFVESKLLPWTKMVLEAELRGCELDVTGLESYAKELREKSKEMEAALEDMWAAGHKAYHEEQLAIINAKYDAQKQTKATPARRAAALAKAATRVSYSSPTQMAWLLRDFLGYDITSLEGSQSTGKEVLERLAAQGKKDVELFLEWRATDKLLTAFIPTYLDIQTDGVIHPQYNMVLKENDSGGESGTKTGRLSCIAKGQLVSGPGFDKPIEEIEVGDLVYTIDNKGLPTIKKVLAKKFMGVKECVEVKWQASGTGRIGSLICTADHRVRTKSGEWKQAQELSRYEKLTHLYINRKESRPRVYSVNSFCEGEQGLIKREVFKADRTMHIHHIDENPRNNLISNLIVLRAKEHASMHGKEFNLKNPEHWKNLLKRKPTHKKLDKSPIWIHYSRFSLLKMIAKAKGRPTKIEHDFETIKRKLKLADISFVEVAKRYGADGKFISRGRLSRALSQGSMKASRELRIGSRALKSLCKTLNFEYNHAVCKVYNAGLLPTYDLTIEDTHNFIASEICVHNCELPNVQQAPPSVKRFIRARSGCKLVGYDLAAIEMRLIAAYTEDENYFDLMRSGTSMHDKNVQVFLQIDTPTSEIKEKHPVERSASKNVGFALAFNAGANRIRVAFAQKGIMLSEAQARAVHKRWKQQYRRTQEYSRELVEFFEEGGKTVNLMGRPIGIERPEDCYMKSLNLLVQSTASDILLEWSHNTLVKARSLGIDCHPLLFVHDFVGFEVEEEKAKEFETLLTNELKMFTIETGQGPVYIEAEGGIYDGWEKE